jgi:5,10-methenyltetrahydrofolate synthetase
MPPTLSSKAELRKRALVMREQERQGAFSAGRPWGQSHLKQLDSFLQEQFRSADPSEADRFSQKCSWAGYYAIGSELNLIEAAQQRSWWMPHALPDGTLNWYPWNADIHHWPRDQRNLPVPPSSCQPRTYSPAADGPWIVLAPCLAADSQGFRLGYGGGYYDRFLSQFGENVLAVTCVPEVCFWKNQTLPHEAHDQPVDIVVTEHDVHVVDTHRLKRKLSLFNC